ncbi:hypothetical protein ACFYY8_31430 [Streptosporangium sp. NPDC001559]|uniref:hypothetical protein n=1 Tax=Streptosporangium sp. NPDC001559 TaxID=3366187 RepID=UPI0036E329F8
MTDRRCTCILIDDFNTPCGEVPEVEFVMGCVNEHLDTDAFCARHKHLALTGELVCTECLPLGVREVCHVLSDGAQRYVA